MNAIAGTAHYPPEADSAPAGAPPSDPAAAAAASAAAGLPSSIPEYLQRLRQALHGADPALIQDALYDAEEYLRAEMAENPQRSEAQIIASVAGSYGAPDEVAEIYRDTEAKVQTALRPPRPAQRRSWLGRFFGVALEPRTYGALFYMLLSLATGTFYFTWVVTGASVSASLLILIVGLPLLILFLGSVRVLALVEGRLVETMLGERMPRRPLYSDRERPWLERIKEMFTDPRTWGTLLYLLLMLPLGTAYFSVAITALALSLSLIFAPIAQWTGLFHGNICLDYACTNAGSWGVLPEALLWPLCLLTGVLLLFATLHLARGIGYLHAQLAKALLVRWG
ncbi:sensor domain-containing protein [Lysobacter yananisis]|uniref:Sensor domain-containing protein n=1 Tax=Lysobacter yananisis TaxID=1003114 RepID=A0ABY9P8N6_9GAMM|nr:sensor domain-containing protein [Lysobacter yananisis]WMT03165.1 sensor domain-containing protein [Lysobacter yananisis]